MVCNSVCSQEDQSYRLNHRAHQKCFRWFVFMRAMDEPICTETVPSKKKERKKKSENKHKGTATNQSESHIWMNEWIVVVFKSQFANIWQLCGTAFPRYIQMAESVDTAVWSDFSKCTTGVLSLFWLLLQNGLSSPLVRGYWDPQ